MRGVNALTSLFECTSFNCRAYFTSRRRHLHLGSHSLSSLTPFTTIRQLQYINTELVAAWLFETLSTITSNVSTELPWSLLGTLMFVWRGSPERNALGAANHRPDVRKPGSLDPRPSLHFPPSLTSLSTNGWRGGWDRSLKPYLLTSSHAQGSRVPCHVFEVAYLSLQEATRVDTTLLTTF